MSDEKILSLFVILTIMIFAVFMNYNKIKDYYKYKDQNRSEYIHTLATMGIPAQKDCE